jgi:hypothetical protein
LNAAGLVKNGVPPLKIPNERGSRIRHDIAEVAAEMAKVRS